MVLHPSAANLIPGLNGSVVIQSRSDSEVRLYHRLYRSNTVGEKHLCVVVKWRRDDPFLITAFFTDRPKRGAVLWPTE